MILDVFPSRRAGIRTINVFYVYDHGVMYGGLYSNVYTKEQIQICGKPEKMPNEVYQQALDLAKEYLPV